MFTTTVQPTVQYQDNLRNAESNLHVGNITQALRYLDQAAEIEPSAPEASRYRIQIRGNIAQTLAQRNNKSQATQFINVALKQVEQYIQTGAGGASPYRYQANLYKIAATYNLLPNAREKEEQAMLQAINRSPYNISDRIELADLYLKLGINEKAKSQYHKAIELSDLYYLDPGKQLTEKQKNYITQQLQNLQNQNDS